MRAFLDLFFCLDDTISAGGACTHDGIAKGRSTSQTCRELWPFYTSWYIHGKSGGVIFGFSVCFLLLKGRECWEMRKKDKVSLERTGWANFTALNEQKFVNQTKNEHWIALKKRV